MVAWTCFSEIASASAMGLTKARVSASAAISEGIVSGQMKEEAKNGRGVCDKQIRGKAQVIVSVPLGTRG